MSYSASTALGSDTTRAFRASFQQSFKNLTGLFDYSAMVILIRGRGQPVRVGEDENRLPKPPTCEHVAAVRDRVDDDLADLRCMLIELDPPGE